VPARRLRTSTPVVLIGVALVAAIVWHIRHVPEAYPYGDYATTSIYTLRAAKGELSTGAYSQFHWHHPGPLLYEMLAPLYVLSGRLEVSLKWTMLILNVSVLAALLTYLSRWSKWLSATTALALLPLIYFEQRLLFWAWNPAAPLLSLALGIALAAGVCAGDVTVLPWLCAVVSFLVQTHVGLAPVSLLLTAAALGAVLWRLRSPGPDERRAAGRALAFSAAIAVALWAVPVVHDLRAGSSNLAAIARFFAASHPSHPWSQVADIFANELVAAISASRELITGDLPASASSVVRAWAMIELLLLSVTAVWSYGRGRRFEAAFSTLCLLASLVGLVAVRSIVDDISDYQIIWIGVIGALNVAALASSLDLMWPLGPLTALPGDRPWRTSIAIGVSGIALLGAIRLDGKQRADSRDHTLLHIASDVSRYCDEHHYVRPLFTFDWKVWDAAAGVVLQLYKADRPVSVADDAGFMFGEPFARTGGEPAELYLMSTGDITLPAGVTRFTRIATTGEYRLVQVFRN
jgi:hypothetical protein